LDERERKRNALLEVPMIPHLTDIRSRHTGGEDREGDVEEGLVESGHARMGGGEDLGQAGHVGEVEGEASKGVC
jgi:hypothetical protein